MASPRETVPVGPIGATLTTVTVRPTTPKGAATRERILDAATVLFHENGVDATGLDDVLAGSHTGKSQLYHYFGGKSGLVDDVIDTQADRILGWHTELLADVDDIAGLRRWAEAVVAAVAERQGAFGCPLGSLAVQVADRSETHRARITEGFTRWEGVLEAAVARIVTDPARAADRAAVLLTALQGGLLLAEATHRTRHLRLGLDAAIAGVERSVTTTPRRRLRRGSSH